LLLSFLLSALSVNPTGGGAMEWRHQLGGVIAFIYADLIVIPILDIYRKYYG